MSNKETLKEKLKNGLIVSCQAVEDEPHYMEGITTTFAKCAQWAGAVGIRANSPKDIRSIKAEVDLPVIGLWKIDRNMKDVYLTPNLDAAKQLWEAGAEIIAIQATNHYRDDNKLSYELISEIKSELPDALIFADVATVKDAEEAIRRGADFVAPTLAGYTKAGHYDQVRIENEPNYELLKEIVQVSKNTGTEVIMEGKVNSPEIAKKCLALGAFAVVVGNAITRPHITARRFVEGIK